MRDFLHKSCTLKIQDCVEDLTPFDLKFSTFWSILLFLRVFVENIRHDGELGYRN